MSGDLMSAMSSAASGLRAQTVRIRVSAENLANANSTGDTPGADPYQRKVPVFKNYLDRESGAERVKVSGVHNDTAPFTVKFDPTHPAADEGGMVKYSNVSALVEMTDMREAQRAYEANLNVVEASRSMLLAAVDILKA
ncbi:flagellar basal body rod protein FlgC [Hirschia baltica]|uniref:Flagellar basal-body rod protein FlgC n=1 Tax=Hirschia baltica (strain ATCC 49814 / DSM 5838 / IFAM 1418) TaxID=582402 RepID=C6XNK2_HIRBI|nr:flagellar basal body rod protein FlgC [Hirschia baltica]ACT58255.1 flagellar basal-body rod protein FlgC [Hirschia baltica ATCC 49814]